MRQPANHARNCFQKCCIPPVASKDRRDYGRCCHDHGGATIVCFEHLAARTTLRRRSHATAFWRIGRELDTHDVVPPDWDIAGGGHHTWRVRRS